MMPQFFVLVDILCSYFSGQGLVTDSKGMGYRIANNGPSKNDDDIPKMGHLLPWALDLMRKYTPYHNICLIPAFLSFFWKSAFF